MRWVGIDIGAEQHVVAALDETGATVIRPTSFAEDSGGYERLLSLLAKPDNCLIVMEATGHYWQNLFSTLDQRGFSIALVNPVRTRRFADGDLARTKTDSIDAMALCRFAAQKRPTPTRLPDRVTRELRELVRLRDRLNQDRGDQMRHLHRVLDLAFPEFTRHVGKLDTALATSLLECCPTADAFAQIPVQRLARLKYDGRHRIGVELARALVADARSTVGAHQSAAYQLQVRQACQTLALLRQQIGEVVADIERLLQQHDTGLLLTSIDGIGRQTAARLVAELGDVATRFPSASALAAYVGVVPALRHSGKRQATHAGISHIGHADLRAALWMPTLVAVNRNPWLRAYYQRLRAAGKLPKVALIAAMRKLLAAIYSVAKNRRPFVPRLPQEVTS
jgi:transposase